MVVFFSDNYSYKVSQCSPVWETGTIPASTPLGDAGTCRLNVVRSGRPEQYQDNTQSQTESSESQCSPVWETGTIRYVWDRIRTGTAVSM